MNNVEAIEDARLQRNLYGSYKTAEEAIKAMLPLARTTWLFPPKIYFNSISTTVSISSGSG